MPLEEQLEETKQKISQKIKIALIKNGMTQTDLAKQIKVSRQQLNRAIQGDTAPKSSQIRKQIYQILGMDGE